MRMEQSAGFFEDADSLSRVQTNMEPRQILEFHLKKERKGREFDEAGYRP